MPGTWAPSTSNSTFRARHSRASRSTGKTSAVGLVTWSTTTIRVRAFIAAISASTTTCGSWMGSGTGTSTYSAPVWRPRYLIALRTAL